MSTLEILLLAVLLPLFPASMLFNLLEQRIAAPQGKAVLMLAWSQLAAWAAQQIQTTPPDWVLYWALATAGVYAFRALVLNELTTWSAFLFVSLLALFWLQPVPEHSQWLHPLQALLLTAPATLLNLLAASLKNRFGTTYLGLVHGLVHGWPRLAALMVACVLAIMATPPFPGFFFLLEQLGSLDLPMAGGVLLVWYLWGWAGLRLLQRLVLGQETTALDSTKVDLPLLPSAGVFLLLLVLAISGLWMAVTMAGGAS